VSRYNKYRDVGGTHVKPLCNCGKEGCPNAGRREINRPVKGSPTSTIPEGSGPRFKANDDQVISRTKLPNGATFTLCRPAGGTSEADVNHIVAGKGGAH
jgi:hypothetical protein